MISNEDKYNSEVTDDGMILYVDAETLNAVMSILGEARDETNNYVLNELYDFVESHGFRGQGFDTRMIANPNYDSNEGDIFPETIPALYRS